MDSSSYAAKSQHGSARRLQATILQCLAQVWEPLQPETALVSQVAAACLPYLHVDAPDELAVRWQRGGPQAQTAAPLGLFANAPFRLHRTQQARW